MALNFYKTQLFLERTKKFNSVFIVLFFILIIGIFSIAIHKDWFYIHSDSSNSNMENHSNELFQNSKSDVLVQNQKYIQEEYLELKRKNQNLKLELEKSNERINSMEMKIKNVEKKAAKTYPDVKFLNNKDRKRILITGGAGFVGSHLTDRLLLEGHEVIVADNFFTGRKRNVEHWVGHENFEIMNHDIVNPIFIEVDQIYHLASPASPPHYMYNPTKTIKTNTVGTINVLGLGKRVGARVLIASTSEVYGDPEVHPQPESYWGHVNPIGPRACYDESKRISETLAMGYHKQEKVEVRIARIFNTYGPRMHMQDGRVVSNFILQALQGEDITIYGLGNQTRSFQYVDDLVDGLIRLMNSNYMLPVNLGNPDERTIKDFAALVQSMIGGKSSLIYKPAVEDDPQKRRPDITVAKKYLGWEPQVPVKEGLRKTINYFREELKRSRHSERNFHRPSIPSTFLSGRWQD